MTYPPVQLRRVERYVAEHNARRKELESVARATIALGRLRTTLKRFDALCDSMAR